MPNTSGRITAIYDKRSNFPASSTYGFVYTDSRLSSMYTLGQATTFTYSAAMNVASPWGAGDYGTARALSSVRRAAGSAYSFTYGEAGGGTTGELATYTLPYGGRIRWTYRDFTFTGNRTVRELYERWLAARGSGHGDSPLAMAGP